MTDNEQTGFNANTIKTDVADKLGVSTSSVMVIIDRMRSVAAIAVAGRSLKDLGEDSVAQKDWVRTLLQTRGERVQYIEVVETRTGEVCIRLHLFLAQLPRDSTSGNDQ